MGKIVTVMILRATSVHSVTITKYHKLAFIKRMTFISQSSGSWRPHTSRFSIWALAHFSGSYMAFFLLCSHNAEEIRELSWGLFYMGTNPFITATSL